MKLADDRQNGLIEDLGAIMGTEATMRLIAVFAPGSLYVPASFDLSHAIALTVGRVPFERLVDAFGGEVLHLPDNTQFERYRRVRQVARLFADGESVIAIANRLACTPRTVRNLRHAGQRLKLDGRQLPKP